MKDLDKLLSSLIWEDDTVLPAEGEDRRTKAMELLTEKEVYLSGNVRSLEEECAGGLGPEVLRHRQQERQPSGSRGQLDWMSTTLFLIACMVG